VLLRQGWKQQRQRPGMLVRVRQVVERLLRVLCVLHVL